MFWTMVLCYTSLYSLFLVCFSYGTLLFFLYHGPMSIFPVSGLCFYDAPVFLTCLGLWTCCSLLMLSSQIWVCCVCLLLQNCYVDWYTILKMTVVRWLAYLDIFTDLACVTISSDYNNKKKIKIKTSSKLKNLSFTKNYVAKINT